MLKYVYIIGAIILLSFILFIVFIKWLNTSSTNYIRKMLRKEGIKSSMVFQENGVLKMDIRSSDMMSLASTVKIMVAMEYAYQAAEGKVDGETPISLKDLEKYYLAGLDGGSHKAWLKHAEEKGFIENDQVSLKEVAKGMITFSSNANTEFLMEKLSLQSIEDRMKEIGVKNHSTLYYFVSAVFIPYEIKQREYPDLTMKAAKKHIVEEIRKMNDDELLSFSTIIHDKLMTDKAYKEKVNVSDWWHMDYDQLYSEIFIKSTTFEYATIMQKVNNKLFPESVSEEMEYLLGALMENPVNQTWLKRAGKKGGSTQYILTDALFAEDKNGNKFEMAIFFNKLEWYETQKLMNSLNGFELQLLSDKMFREEIYERL